MSTRILNRQRQMAEQGRLRLGYTVAAKKRDGSATTRPVRSETWVLTSHSRAHIEHAAELWGGEVEEWQPMGNGSKQWRVITKTSSIDAILPPGEPLTQAYEQWSKGGCQRRCDGVTEQFSGSPCLCLAQFGDTWYEQSARDVCVSKSRLKVLLPDMEGLGAWRMETGSFYATDEIAGMVDTLRGAVGDSVLIPVALRIEPRTRVAGGETKQFVVPVLELRGVTAGALLSGEAQRTGQLILNDPEKTPRELEAAAAKPAAVPDYLAQAQECSTVEAVKAIWWKAKNAGHMTDQLEAELGQVATSLASATGQAPKQTAPPAEPDSEGVYDADVVEDPASDGDADAVWQQVLAAAGLQGMTQDDVLEGFAAFSGGVTAATATAGELSAYLEHLRAGVPA